MSIASIILGAISIAITWGGFALCLSIATKKSKTELSE